MMKKYIKYMASLLAVSFAMSACIDLEEMNVDPNNATTTNPSLLLTGVAYSAFNQTSSDACHAAKMLILTSGESKYQVYKWTRGDFDYYSNLRDVTKMSEEAGEGSAYQALAHFFRANYFYQLTLWTLEVFPIRMRLRQKQMRITSRHTIRRKLCWPAF